MAAIRTHEGKIAVISGTSVALYNLRAPADFTTSVITLQEPDAKSDLKQASKADESARLALGNCVLAAAFSRNGRYLAACDDRKYLHVYAGDEGHWTLVSSKCLARRATSVTFTRDESAVLVADKSGDVYSFPTGGSLTAGGEGRREGRLLLGHLSMVLDMCLAANDTLVVTCDRDEKIRISHFPNAYSIHSYCLGHREFVSCVRYVEELDVVISASGDCSVRVWDLHGKQLCLAQCLPYRPAATSPSPVPQTADEEEAGSVTSGDCTQTTTTPDRQRPAIQRLAFCSRCRCLAVSFYGCPEVRLYQLTAAGGQVALRHAQTIPLAADAWDLAFDGDVLWVLCPVEGATLTAYRAELTEPENLTQLTEIADSGSSAFQLTKSVNSRWDFFKVSLQVPSAVPTLWKTASQANVLEYQQRKEQRLQLTRSSKRAANSSAVTSSPDRPKQAGRKAKRVC